MKSWDESTLTDLLDGRLEWPQVKEIMSSYKDADRFEKMIAILEARMPWDEKIVLPLGPHLFIVKKDDGSYVTKSTSGHEFGDYRENWKLEARVFVRRSDKHYQEIYPQRMHAHPDWMELREYYDPKDGTLLEIEAVPPGYPITHSFQPDLETFYQKWLGRPLP